MPEQSLADLQRLVDRSRRDSRHNYGAHPTGAGGSLHTPHPKQGTGRQQVGPGEFGLSRPPIGEIIRLHVHGHLGNGGEPALFDSITYQNGFNQATAPNPQLQLPYNAIYGIEGEVRWTDGYTGGGEVWLYLDAAPYMQLPGFTEAWTRWPIAMEFDAQKGARLSLVVVHDDSADHDLEGEVVVATKERLVQLVVPDPEIIVRASPIDPMPSTDGVFAAEEDDGPFKTRLWPWQPEVSVGEKRTPVAGELQLACAAMAGQFATGPGDPVGPVEAPDALTGWTKVGEEEGVVQTLLGRDVRAWSAAFSRTATGNEDTSDWPSEARFAEWGSPSEYARTRTRMFAIPGGSSPVWNSGSQLIAPGNSDEITVPGPGAGEVMLFIGAASSQVDWVDLSMGNLGTAFVVEEPGDLVFDGTNTSGSVDAQIAWGTVTVTR